MSLGAQPAGAVRGLQGAKQTERASRNVAQVRRWPRGSASTLFQAAAAPRARGAALTVGGIQMERAAPGQQRAPARVRHLQGGLAPPGALAAAQALCRDPHRAAGEHDANLCKKRGGWRRSAESNVEAQSASRAAAAARDGGGCSAAAAARRPKPRGSAPSKSAARLAHFPAARGRRARRAPGGGRRPATGRSTAVCPPLRCRCRLRLRLRRHRWGETGAPAACWAPRFQARRTREPSRCARSIALAPAGAGRSWRPPAGPAPPGPARRRPAAGARRGRGRGPRPGR
jgi:hypothetical protein